jgi:HSP20 family protein
MKDLVPFFNNRLSLSRSVFDELDRAFNDVFGKDFFPTSLTRSAYPKMNIYDEDGSLHLDACIPEVPKDKVSVTVDNNILTIKGGTDSDKKSEGANYYCREISKRSFSRSVQLPENIDSDSIKASFSDGMLKVVMPYHKEEDKKQNIKKINIS